ncbi:MAG: hypothetical protein ACT4PV_08475 [Planctomycetaceae bacterium]
MERNVYVILAVVGATLLLLQVVLQLFGLYGDADLDAGHDGAGADGHGSAFFGFLSFKALSSFSGIFGLTGLVMLGQSGSRHIRLAVATGAGLAGVVLVGWMMRGLSKLSASGTVNLENAVGKTASVYLRIPGERSGAGKVTVEIQGRTMEISAITDGSPIATGTRVKVNELVGDDTLKVAAL